MPSKSTKQTTEPALSPCPPEVAFRFVNGASARELIELRNVLERLDVSTLEHHRDHYHHWVRDVLTDRELADDLRELGERTSVRGPAYRTAVLKLLDPHTRSQGKRPAKAKAASTKPATRRGGRAMR